jgi:hypothetical protein
MKQQRQPLKYRFHSVRSLCEEIQVSQDFKTLKETISAVLAIEHEWPLAALAYKQLKEGNPELLTDEEVNFCLFEEYVKEVNEMTYNGEPLSTIKKAMDFVSFRIVFAYGLERVTQKPLNAGGYMTLFGHASYQILRMGYAGMIASDLDGGAMEGTFKTYVLADDGILKALNSRDTESATKLFPIRNVSLLQLEEDYENLMQG